MNVIKCEVATHPRGYNCVLATIDTDIGTDTDVTTVLDRLPTILAEYGAILSPKAVEGVLQLYATNYTPQVIYSPEQKDYINICKKNHKTNAVLGVQAVYKTRTGTWAASIWVIPGSSLFAR